jgi:hypothetical protein
MWALLSWVDGFGADTWVRGIFPTREEAESHAEESDGLKEFDFGLVNFDIYHCERIGKAWWEEEEEEEEA